MLGIYIKDFKIKTYLLSDLKYLDGILQSELKDRMIINIDHSITTDIDGANTISVIIFYKEKIWKNLKYVIG